MSWICAEGSARGIPTVSSARGAGPGRGSGAAGSDAWVLDWAGRAGTSSGADTSAMGRGAADAVSPRGWGSGRGAGCGWARGAAGAITGGGATGGSGKAASGVGGAGRTATAGPGRRSGVDWSPRGDVVRACALPFAFGGVSALGRTRDFRCSSGFGSGGGSRFGSISRTSTTFSGGGGGTRRSGPKTRNTTWATSEMPKAAASDLSSGRNLLSGIPSPLETPPIAFSARTRHTHENHEDTLLIFSRGRPVGLEHTALWITRSGSRGGIAQYRVDNRLGSGPDAGCMGTSLNSNIRRLICGASLSTPKCVSASKSRCTSPTADQRLVKRARPPKRSRVFI